MNTEPVFTWKTYEYEYKKKSSDWFWALGIISVAGAVTSIILGNFIFALLILVGAFTLALYADRHPDLRHFEVNNRGIKIDSTLYPFSSLESFWVEVNEPDHGPKLLLKSQRFFMPHIVIPIKEVHPEELRDFLLTKIKEEEHNDSISHRILEYFGF